MIKFRLEGLGFRVGVEGQKTENQVDTLPKALKPDDTKRAHPSSQLAWYAVAELQTAP